MGFSLCVTCDLKVFYFKLDFVDELPWDLPSARGFADESVSGLGEALMGGEAAGNDTRSDDELEKADVNVGGASHGMSCQ